ncbi:MAG: hypothetical protein HYR70_02250 [Chloroflexi bacterium]|nr:hypothetical protein [Chloroflexota bacterium]MBI1856045.1 hypothetical protein [Chloroflexota bacterium]MBI3340988.1 hypothetical protein [Chloroflexota bacterium]
MKKVLDILLVFVLLAAIGYLVYAGEISGGVNLFVTATPTLTSTPAPSLTPAFTLTPTLTVTPTYTFTPISTLTAAPPKTFTPIGTQAFTITP